jgi:peptide-methionine (S)-S-oxide reductase
VFVNDEEQRAAAERAKTEQQEHYRAPVVTQIEPAQTFYVAEDYHQQYLEKRGRSTCTPALRAAARA